MQRISLNRPQRKPDLHYYDLQRHWRKVKPHLGDKKLNAILIRDFNKFTFGRWRKRFRPGQYPRDFETCDWSYGHRGPEPHFWRYVKHSACHWLVNFNLRLAQLVDPSRPWRIVTSQKHSTVWDGDKTLFECNFLALGVAPKECFALANKKQLPIGKEIKVHLAQRFSLE